MKYLVFLLILLIINSCKQSTNDNYKLLNQNYKTDTLQKIENRNEYLEYFVQFIKVNKTHKNMLALLFKGNFMKDQISIYFSGKLILRDKLYYDESTGQAGYYEFYISNEIKNFSIQFNRGNLFTLNCDSNKFAYEILLKDGIIYIENVEKIIPSI